MSIKSVEMPSYDRLNELLKYNPEDGELRWKVSRGSVKPGDIAALVDTDERGRQYYRITIDNKMYLSHRVIWMIYHHEDPGPLTIDHVNRNPLDNRITNLRLATAYQQNLNTCRTSATVLARRPGLVIHSRRSDSRPRWSGQIRVAGKYYAFGSAAVNTINDEPPQWLVERAARLYALRDDPGITDDTLIDEINALKRVPPVTTAAK